MNEELLEYLEDNYEPVDTDKEYDDYLDNNYSFHNVGGPFTYLVPSKVLKEMSPTDYRIDKQEFLDNSDLMPLGTEYWRKNDYEDAESELEAEKEEDDAETEEE